MEKVTSGTLLIFSIDTMEYWHTNVWIKSYIRSQQDSRQTDGLEDEIIRERKVLPVPHGVAEVRRPASCGRTNCRINKARSEVYEFISTICSYFGTNAIAYSFMSDALFFRATVPVHLNCVADEFRFVGSKLTFGSRLNRVPSETWPRPLCFLCSWAQEIFCISYLLWLYLPLPLSF